MTSLKSISGTSGEKKLTIAKTGCCSIGQSLMMMYEVY